MRSYNVPTRSVSPIARMQRAYYPREPHPLAHLQGLGRFGVFGDLTQGITGVKAGVSAGTTTAAIGTGIASAIGAGAAAGSVVPIIGTAIGVIVALVASGVFSHRVDPEVGSFNNAIALVRSQGPTAVLGIQDKYLVLAGLFDLEPGQIKGNIPIYKKYGRMGEQKFVMDMCALIQSAANQGIITANDTVQSVHDKVVQPWINSWGYGPMSDSNAEMIDMLILGLIGEYVSGQYKQRWFAVGGDFPFNNLPLFALPAASGVTPTTSGTPVPTTAPSAASGAPAGFTPAGTSPYGQTLYSRPGDANLYTVTNGQVFVYTPVQSAPSTIIPPAGTVSTPLVTAPAQPAQQSAVPVPTGFTLIGSSNNLPAYQGPDGFFYSWSGTTMSPLTGYLQTSSGQGAQVTGGALTTAPAQPVLPSLSTNTQAGVSPYAAPVYSPYTAPSAPLPTIAPTQSVSAAGVDTSALPSWLTWGAVASVVGIMVMTARHAPSPAGGTSRRRR
jgi:hypothetical protein